MNTNGSRNWLLWLAIIFAVVAVVYFVRTRMNKPMMPAVEDSIETNVDAAPAPEPEVVVEPSVEQPAE